MRTLSKEIYSLSFPASVLPLGRGETCDFLCGGGAATKELINKDRSNENTKINHGLSMVQIKPKDTNYIIPDN